MKPTIKVINGGELPSDLKKSLEAEFKKQNNKPDFTMPELKEMISAAFSDAMKKDIFKDMPEELKLALKETFAENLPCSTEREQPDLARIGRDIFNMLAEHHVNYFEGLGVLESVKTKLVFQSQCKKVKD